MKVKDTLIERERQRATEEADVQSSFIKNKYRLYVFARLLLLAGMGVSAATEGWHLNNKFESYLLTVVLVVIIESISIVIGNMVVNDIRNGIFSASTIAQIMFAFQVLLYGGATYFSVSLTLEGAPDFYEYRKQQIAPPPQVNIDSIKGAYAIEIASIDAMITEQQGTRWKGTITTQANRNINQLIKQKQAEKVARDQAVADAQLLNNEAKAKWEANVADDQKIVMGFAGLGEIIKIFAIIFIALFKEGRNKELGIHAVERQLGVDSDGDGEVSTPKKERTVPGYKIKTAAAETPAAPPPPSTPPTKIGFEMPWLKDAKVTTPESIAPDSVATCGYTPTSDAVVKVDIEAYFNHYKQHRSQQKAVLSHPRYTEKRRKTKAAEHEQHMQIAISRLEQYGRTIQINDKEHRAEILLVPV